MIEQISVGKTHFPLEDYLLMFEILACKRGLQEEVKDVFQQILTEESSSQLAKAIMNLPSYRHGFKLGVDEGVEKTVQQGMTASLVLLLELRFGQLAEDIRQRIEAAEVEQIKHWTQRQTTAAHLAEVFEEDRIMPPHYLRVEGVNLAHVLEDTRQLSVIRGGGLLLRQAVMDLPKELPQLKLKKISTGASIGLFGFESDTPDDTVNAVAKHLRKHSQYQHLTFVVDSQPESTDFQHDKEALIARNRFRQMQQITVAVSEKNTSQEIGPCALDNVRPTTGHESVATERENVSLSVSVRLKHGRKQKQQFYDKETGQTLGLNYTTDLQDLAALTKQQAETPELKQLNNKIAVLYFDGNGFSGIQARHCDTKDKQLKFDKDIQGKRKAFLIALLNKIKLDSDFSNGNALRLETLLWGGDEMIFVVPAWKGLETLNFFYEHSADWAFPGSGEKLTHAGGLVFCSAKTPIQRATQLARELADGVKSRPEGRERNLFDYMVLESIDFPTESLEHTRQRQFGEAMGKTRAPLCPFNHEMKAAADWLKNLPKGQAYTCARAALADAKDDGKRLKEQVERLAEVSQIKPDDIENSLKCLFPTTPNTGWQWLHLVDLWDYLLDGGNYAGGT